MPALIDNLTSVQIGSIVRRYQNGESSIKIAEHYGVSGSTIIKLLRKMNVEIKGRGRYAQ